MQFRRALIATLFLSIGLCLMAYNTGATRASKATRGSGIRTYHQGQDRVIEATTVAFEAQGIQPILVDYANASIALSGNTAVTPDTALTNATHATATSATATVNTDVLLPPVDLGTLGGANSNALAVNDNGMVVGTSDMSGNATTHAFVWTQAGGMIDLGTLGGSSSSASAVNNNGMVVGSSVTPGNARTHAFVWTQAGGMVDLGTLVGGRDSYAVAVNNNGMVVGSSDTAAGSHAFAWTQAGGMVDLGTLNGTSSQALGVNDSGMVVGGANHAFVWTQGGGMVDLGTLGGTGSYAVAVNNNGMVVGQSSLPGSFAPHAFVWTQAGGMVDLGSFDPSFFTARSSASAVNNNGMVVGSSDTSSNTGSPVHAFSWTQVTGMVDLGTVPGNQNSNAVAVNDNGKVVGNSGTSDFPLLSHAFAWTQAGGMVDLGRGGISFVIQGGLGSYYRAVNGAGMTVGVTRLPGTNPVISHATLWPVSVLPRIDAVSPAVPVRSSTDQSVVVTGSGFQQNLTATLSFPSGASTTLSGAQIQNVTSNSFTMLTTLNASGSWSLRVNNPDGSQSNTFSFSVGSGPLISSLSPPSPVASGSDQNIPVFGSGFQPNLSVSVTFPNGNGTTLSGPAQIQNVTPTSFTMVATLNATGTWRIRGNNPNGGGQSNLYSFTVRAPALTITAINPDPVTAGVATTLIVTGSNFRSGFSASVTSPCGTFDIASAELTLVSSNEIRVQVTMWGTPQYQAILKIFYSNGQTATKSFQVTGTPTTCPLAGKIGIWEKVGDEEHIYKLRGASVTLQVYAKPSDSPNAQAIPATVIDSQYSFPSNAFLPNTDYDIHVELTYNDTIYAGVTLPCVTLPFIGLVCSPCESLDSTRRTSLVKTRFQHSTSSSQSLDFDFKPPIIMAHGIWSCFEKWHSDSTNNTANWGNYLRSLGFITFTPNYDWHISTSNITNGIGDWENRASLVAQQIRSDFSGLIGETSDDYPPWVYVGHSMGGLIGRVLTNKSDDANRPLVSKLKKMYLLGTPNSGSFGAGERTIKDYLSIPYIRKTINGVYPFFFGSRPTTLSKVKAYAGKWNQWAESDTLVKVDDVFDVIQQIDIPFGRDSFDTLYRLPGKVFVYGHTGLGNPNSKICILTNQILPEICQIQGSQNAVSPCPVAQGTCDQGDGTPARPSRPETGATIAISPRIITSDVLSLTASQTLTIPFQVAATDAISVTALSQSAQVMFSILDPSDHVVDFASLPPTVGQVVSNEFGQFFSLNNPSPGIWSLRAVAGPDEVTISMAATENSPTGFEGFVNPSNAITGEIPHLTGQWVGATNGISSALMSAKLTDESGTTVATVNLLDDGNHGDGAAGDGEFGGDAPAISIAGRYSVIFTTQGNINGQAFWRWGAALLDVVNPTHTFTGSFNDVAIDSDLDGAYDILKENVEISVGTAGGYLVAADLYDAQGYFISHAVGYTQAAAGGVYSVGLNFTVSAAFCSQFSSEFTMKNLTLRDGGALTVLDVYTQNVTTLVYDGSLFGCVSGTPSPSISSVQPNSMFPGGSGQVLIGGNSFQNGAQVSFGAGVSVSSVTFGSSSVLVAQVNVAAGATPGPRDVTITNPDGHSSTATALFTVALDQPPSVSINNLANQQLINGTVTVSATASDDVGIQRVEFYVDGVLSGTDTTFPYQYLWNTGAYSNGPHTFAAKAYDTANQNSTAQVDVVVSCISGFAPAHQSFAASGGNGEITITSGCNWASTSNAPWITIISGSGGTGNGTVNYSVAANNTIFSRTGTLTIAGHIFTVTQTADTDGDGIPDVVEAIEGTNPLVKDNDVFNNARLFVMQQYRDFLGREGDPAGISFWTNQINSGSFTREQVIDSFFNSPEFQGTVSPVTRLYFAYFLRIPDYGGLIFWVTQYRNGASLDTISQFFAQSPEFQGRYGNLDNSQFVTLLYQNVLGRAPDPEGLAFWVGHLNSVTLTRGQVMLGFSESAEYKLASFNKVYVTMIYVGMLRRAPEQGGFDFWVNAMNNGASGLNLIQGFLTAPEYHSRFLP